jgi:hypothetical protein
MLDQAILVECYTGHAARVPTDDVHEEAPYECAGSKTGRESDLARKLGISCSGDVWNAGTNRDVAALVTYRTCCQFSAHTKKTLGDPTWESKLLLQRAQNQTKGLSPDQVDEVSESAQAPDVPLVPAKAVVVDLSVDQDALLLVQRVAFQLRLECDSGKSVFIVGVVLWWGWRARVAGTVGG